MAINNITRRDHVSITIKTSNSKPTKPCLPPPKAPSPTNINSFPSNGWMTHPTKCILPGRIGGILGFEDYYFESERVLCTQAFLVDALSTSMTVNTPQEALNLMMRQGKLQHDGRPILKLLLDGPWSLTTPGCHIGRKVHFVT
jgi:hypothetical protein